MKKITDVVFTIGSVLLIIFAVVGGIKLKNYIRYTVSYQTIVTDQLKPLENRIDVLSDTVIRLERRVETLEKK